jgi:hypothetical protein
LSAGDIHPDAAPKLARGPRTNNQQPTSTRIGSASSLTTTRRRLRFGRADPRPRAEYAMFTRQYGTCAICPRMVSETLCVDRCPKTAAARHLICDACEAWRDLDEADPDVARLVAAYRDCARDEDGW